MTLYRASILLWGYTEIKQEAMVSARKRNSGRASGVHLNEGSSSAFRRRRRAHKPVSVTIKTGVMAHDLLAPRANGVNIRIAMMQDRIMRLYGTLTSS
jgi:hypothetical protein